MSEEPIIVERAGHAVGEVRERSPGRWEARDGDDSLIGVFTTAGKAIDAVLLATPETIH